MMTLLAHTVLQRFPGGAEMKNGNFWGPAWELSRLSLSSTLRINTRGRGQGRGRPFGRTSTKLDNGHPLRPVFP